MGSLVSKLCKDLHIEKIKTSPYHPECNGVVESTLGAMLTKASAQGWDWVAQVPFALSALRSAPNREPSSPHFNLCMDTKFERPLIFSIRDWAEVEFKELNASEWSEWLAERLECWHDVLRERGKHASEQRKANFDKKAVERTLTEGDQVLFGAGYVTETFRVMAWTIHSQAESQPSELQRKCGS